MSEYLKLLAESKFLLDEVEKTLQSERLNLLRSLSLGLNTNTMHNLVQTQKCIEALAEVLDQYDQFVGKQYD